MSAAKSLSDLNGLGVIPLFAEHGYLPPGIHPATLDEVAARFGYGSELRQV